MPRPFQHLHKCPSRHPLCLSRSEAHRQITPLALATRLGASRKLECNPISETLLALATQLGASNNLKPNLIAPTVLQTLLGTNNMSVPQRSMVIRGQDMILLASPVEVTLVLMKMRKGCGTRPKNGLKQQEGSSQQPRTRYGGGSTRARRAGREHQDYPPGKSSRGLSHRHCCGWVSPEPDAMTPMGVLFDGWKVVESCGKLVLAFGRVTRQRGHVQYQTTDGSDKMPSDPI